MAQNSGETRLFHNVAARPGFTVHLHGTAGNPSGIGAVIRMETTTGMGPAREIHCGGGYMSQDAATAVLGVSGDPLAVHVRWPGGATQREPLRTGDRDVHVRIRRD